MDFNTINLIIKEFNLDSNEISIFYLLLIENNDEVKKNLSAKTELQKEFSRYELSSLAYYYYKTNDNNVLEYFKIKDIKNLINGSDLIDLGYKQGAELGNILNSLLDFKMNNPNIFNSKQDEINWVVSNYKI